MKLAIMQPYFLPYIGYWQLMVQSDHWIFFDIVKYNKKSWMNRNRILHPEAGKEFQYISVPVKKSRHDALIREIKIDNKRAWQKEITGKFTLYKRLNAPSYHQTIDLISKIIDVKYVYLLDLLIASCENIMRTLGFHFDFSIASEIEFEKEKVSSPGDWAVYLSKAKKVETYINPYSGFEIFDEEKFLSHGIKLRFLRSKLTAYNQSKRIQFIPALSIVDVLMFNKWEKVANMLRRDFEILTKEQLQNEMEETH